METPPPEANMAAVVRLELAAAREAGVDFDAAWEAALERLNLDRRPGFPQRARELEAWGVGLRAAKPSFARAYNREAPTAGELELRDLLELVA